MKVRLDVLLKASMAEQAVREVGRRLEAGEEVAEELRAAYENGTLREAVLRKLVGEDRLRAIRENEGE